ncbi:MAG: hypothetical protein OXR66_05855 [Candidatus Woesearchaeota archaeon]|nr:hypothetical protein [Candidatus Woesearchaeota archaeon]
MSEEVKDMGFYKYRYRGTFDWENLYQQARTYFTRVLGSEVYFKEKKYKHKELQFEVQWEIRHYYDAFSAWQYNVTLKVVDPVHRYEKVDGKTKRLVEGNLRVWVDYNYISNYEMPTLAGGEKQMFAQGSMLQRMYWKLTWRERYDLAEDVGMFFVHDFIEEIKRLVEAQFGGYASIGEPW